MKLLIDHNLSHRPVARLADAFPESIHVRHIGLERADDIAIWEFARSNGLAIELRAWSSTQGGLDQARELLDP